LSTITVFFCPPFSSERMSVGAVACLRRIKSAISVARKVMEHTKHTILAGDLATEFAIKMGFKEESLTTEESSQMHQEWFCISV